MSQKSVLITGCSSGIGFATAEHLRYIGWRVIASARKPEDVARLHDLGFDAVRLDVADSACIERALAETYTLTGGVLDGLVNNAGIAIPGAMEDLSRENLQRQFDVNFFGLMELTRGVLPAMRRRGRGRIVMVSSILGRVALPWRGAYNASKFALEGAADTLRLELRGTGIHVALVNPGPVKSRFRDNSLHIFDTEVEPGETHGVTYKRLRAETGARKDNQPFTVGPEVVAVRIARALESRHPKARYYITTPAYVLSAARCILPTAWLDAVLARI